MSNFSNTLKALRRMSNSKREEGKMFEKLMKSYLLQAGEYNFKKIWLWDEYPDKNKYSRIRKHGDTGVDLVAKGNNGDLWAIQCKFYSQTTKINNNDLGTFYNWITGKAFDRSMLIYTGAEFASTVEESLRRHDTKLVEFEDLKDRHVNWPDIMKGFTNVIRKEPYTPRKHQKNAIDNTLNGFKKNDVGQLIMACGTGKTFTSLKIAERIGGTILYLVPSLGLMRQTINEWADQKSTNHQYLGVCSDVKVGKTDEDISMSEIVIDVSTDSNVVGKFLNAKKKKNELKVIFSTYQSIKAIVSAQKKKTCDIKFDLVLCDEAHRTTGYTESDTKLSYFHKVHKKHNKINASKRLYMTATDRIFTEGAKIKASANQLVIYSMDDPEIFGPVFYRLKFSEAIKQQLLADYRVIIHEISGDEAVKLSRKYMGKGEVNLNNVSKMMGCWKSLHNPGEQGDVTSTPLQKVIAFSKSINDSKWFTKNFPELVKSMEGGDGTFSCAVDHVDGTTNTLERSKKLLWLEESHENTSECRVLSNARCLAEGINVPSLDAVIFLNPRDSVIDIIQAVGRVMRSSANKTYNYGYIILPVVIPPDLTPIDALNENKNYEMVWKVARALRSHDDRIDQDLLNGKIPENFDWRHKSGGSTIGDPEPKPPSQSDKGEITAEMIHSKFVEHVGNRKYLEDWATDVAQIVGNINVRIHDLIETNNLIKKEFETFHTGLKNILNDSITSHETRDMISQHMIMERIFTALFPNNNFIKTNMITKGMNSIVMTLNKHGLKSETAKLENFYIDVENQISGITTDEGRQKAIKTLYERFFQLAFPKTVKRLGIVYTPIEIVDFILKSTDYVMKNNFGKGLAAKNVNIIDPFAGTGSFISRMISNENNLIDDNMLKYKFNKEIHMNEIVLLAYYMAVINCEHTCYSRIGKNVIFDYAMLTDTFHKKNMSDWTKNVFTEAQIKLEKQRDADITVIIGNPPYSVKGNLEYLALNARIEETYAKKSTVNLKTALYDSYIRALRWASDRVSESGVIAFVTNAGFIRSNSASGIRACLAEEFTDIWCFDLRGNGRVTGDGRNIFEYPGQSTGGTRTPVAIILLIKNPKKTKCTIRYTSLSDEYYSGEDKRNRVKDLESIQKIKDWKIIIPDKNFDWLDQQKEDFLKYTPLGSKDVKSGKDKRAIFKIYSNGVKTARDVWVYNSSQHEIIKNMCRHIIYCLKHGPNKPKNLDLSQATWDTSLTDKLTRSQPNFNKNNIRNSMYRPFFKQKLYFDYVFNQRQGHMKKIFVEHMQNFAILVPYRSADEPSAFITNIVPDLGVLSANQCFPLYIYTKTSKGYDREDNITEFALSEYCEYYNDQKITKIDIFYYIYGLLHNPKYRLKYRNNLIKDLPRIPMAPNFWAFNKCGKELAYLHLNYEKNNYHVLGKPKLKIKKFRKLSFGKIKNINNRRKLDKTKIFVDGLEIFDNIPCITYKVNGRTPLEWIVDRYKITVDKDSGIVNDPCAGVDPISLIERAVYVGLESDTIINNLPKEFEPRSNWRPKKTGLDAYWN